LLRKAAIWALTVVAVVWTWQFLTVHYNYGGNWTALFCIRPGMPVPPFLKSENLYIFQNSGGYDGQVFHLIAHDPWMRKGSREAIAGTAFRYQRIFVPAMAWMLALGQDAWVHAAYFAVILGFIFLGVYWTSMFASRVGLAPAWGLAFALTPAAITSIDRMTADVALAAFAAGFALYCKKTDWRVLTILACAALTRETALPIIAGYSIFLLARKQWTSAVLAAATVAPAAVWFAYVSRGAPSEVPTYIGLVPLAGFLERVIHPAVYPLSQTESAIAHGFDYVALAGVALTLVFVSRIALRKEWSAIAAAIYACTIAMIFLKSRSVWDDAYAFGRVLTPLMFLTMLHGLGRRPWLAVLPIAMVDARIALNLGGQALGIVRGITGLVK
jgi:hypothetical protein